jgi:hypothetical protein
MSKSQLTELITGIILVVASIACVIIIYLNLPPENDFSSFYFWGVVFVFIAILGGWLIKHSIDRYKKDYGKRKLR